MTASKQALVLPLAGWALAAEVDLILPRGVQGLRCTWQQQALPGSKGLLAEESSPGIHQPEL